MPDNTTGWTGGEQGFGDFAPGLVHYTDRVLFDEVWERPDLSKPKAMSAMAVAKTVFANT